MNVNPRRKNKQGRYKVFNNRFAGEAILYQKATSRRKKNTNPWFNIYFNGNCKLEGTGLEADKNYQAFIVKGRGGFELQENVLRRKFFCIELGEGSLYNGLKVKGWKICFTGGIGFLLDQNNEPQLFYKQDELIVLNGIVTKIDKDFINECYQDNGGEDKFLQKLKINKNPFDKITNIKDKKKRPPSKEKSSNDYQDQDEDLKSHIQQNNPVDNYRQQNNPVDNLGNSPGIGGLEGLDSRKPMEEFYYRKPGVMDCYIKTKVKMQQDTYILYIAGALSTGAGVLLFVLQTNICIGIPIALVAVGIIATIVNIAINISNDKKNIKNQRKARNKNRKLQNEILVGGNKQQSQHINNRNNLLLKNNQIHLTTPQNMTPLKNTNTLQPTLKIK